MSIPGTTGTPDPHHPGKSASAKRAGRRIRDSNPPANRHLFPPRYAPGSAPYALGRAYPARKSSRYAQSRTDFTLRPVDQLPADLRIFHRLLSNSRLRRPAAVPRASFAWTSRRCRCALAASRWAGHDEREGAAFRRRLSRGSRSTVLPSAKSPQLPLSHGCDRASQTEEPPRFSVHPPAAGTLSRQRSSHTAYTMIRTDPPPGYESCVATSANTAFRIVTCPQVT
jgi:hypothetical protein